MSGPFYECLCLRLLLIVIISFISWCIHYYQNQALDCNKKIHCSWPDPFVPQIDHNTAPWPIFFGVGGVVWSGSGIPNAVRGIQSVFNFKIIHPYPHCVTNKLCSHPLTPFFGLLSPNDPLFEFTTNFQQSLTRHQKQEKLPLIFDKIFKSVLNLPGWAACIWSWISSS